MIKVITQLSSREAWRSAVTAMRKNISHRQNHGKSDSNAATNERLWPYHHVINQFRWITEFTPHGVGLFPCISCYYCRYLTFFWSEGLTCPANEFQYIP